MKKNKMMRLASVLLVLTLLSTSVISGTFAKYTTQDSASDKARVAKWGVELQVVGNLYGDTYKDTIVNDTTLTVKSSETVDGKLVDVVAPGTKNDEGFTFSLNGTPEVSSKIKATISHENIYLTAGEYGVMVPVASGTINEANYNEFSNLYVGTTGSYTAAGSTYDSTANYYTLEDYVNLSATYYPVEYTLIGGTDDISYNNPTSAGAIAVDTMATLSDLIAGQIGSIVDTETVVSDGKTTKTYESAEIAPNTNLKDSLRLGSQRIVWAWDYCQEGTPGCVGGDNACNACKADTILGNLMAGTALNGEVVKLNGTTYTAPVPATGNEAKDYNLETEFSIDITVTQVD